MKSWTFLEGFKPEEEPLREALCTLGNGYFATRGASAQCEAGDPASGGHRVDPRRGKLVRRDGDPLGSGRPGRQRRSGTVQ